jgi:hypothetical protein
LEYDRQECESQVYYNLSTPLISLNSDFLKSSPKGIQ